MTPSLCGSFLMDKRSFLAFTWTLTTILTLIAFLCAIFLSARIHAHYKQIERYYTNDDYYYNYGNQGEEEDEGGGSHDSADREAEAYLLLATISSRSMSFVAVYTMAMAVALNLYGSTAIVGFTSLRGVFIAPCFSSGSTQMRIGMFGGSIIIFANLLLVCAVIFGEVRVEDYRDGREREEMEPYKVERISTVLAVTCMFLSALYTVFAILLFLCYASERSCGEEEKASHISTDNRHREGFITMEDST